MELVGSSSSRCFDTDFSDLSQLSFYLILSHPLGFTYISFNPSHFFLKVTIPLQSIMWRELCTQWNKFNLVTVKIILCSNNV